MRCVPQLKKNIISIGTLKVFCLEISGRDSVLKMLRGSMIVLKGIQCNNLYYLKGYTAIGQVATSIISGDDCTQLWHMRIRHIGEKSLQALVKEGLLKGDKTCKLNFCEYYVISKKIKVKFGTTIYCTKGILDYAYRDIWGDNIYWRYHYYVSFIDDFSRRCWIYTMKYKEKILELFMEWKMNIKENIGRKTKVLRLNNGGEHTSLSYNYVMVMA